MTFQLRLENLTPAELHQLALDSLQKDAKEALAENTARLIEYGVAYALAEKEYRLAGREDKAILANREQLAILYDTVKHIQTALQSVLRIERETAPPF